jgi:putative PIN family toxin of toxin-antitoxin system
VLRVVLDTNVYVSALIRGGVPLDILLAWTVSERFDLFTSAFILEELEGVLLRKFNWSHAQVRRATTLIRSYAHAVSPQEQLRVIKEDDSDNRILECAQVAKAHIIVTGDSHLLKLGVFEKTIILSPRDFSETYLAS